MKINKARRRLGLLLFAVIAITFTISGYALNGLDVEGQGIITDDTSGLITTDGVDTTTDAATTGGADITSGADTTNGTALTSGNGNGSIDEDTSNVLGIVIAIIIAIAIILLIFLLVPKRKKK